MGTKKRWEKSGKNINPLDFAGFLTTISWRGKTRQVIWGLTQPLFRRWAQDGSVREEARKYRKEAQSCISIESKTTEPVTVCSRLFLCRFAAVNGTNLVLFYFFHIQKRKNTLKMVLFKSGTISYAYYTLLCVHDTSVF